MAMSCQPVSPETSLSPTTDLRPKKRPKNVILLMGNGMGLSHLSGALYKNGNRLNAERFPVVGFHKTYSGNDLIPNPAAANTSIATGVKVDEDRISLAADTMRLTTLLEMAKARNMATGIVTTGRLTDPSAAAFFAHTASAGQQEDIAGQLVTAGLDFFVGGGERYFSGQRTDQRDLKAELARAGYQVFNYRDEALTRVTVNFDRDFAYFTAEETPPSALEGRNFLPPAGKLAAVFLERKARDEGFFLLISNDHIDPAARANDTDKMLAEIRQLDQTAGIILDFAAEKQETLVILTTGYESGGFAINPGSTVETFLPGYNSDSPTGGLAPVFAYGPGAEIFSGIYENTDLFKKIRLALNL